MSLNQNDLNTINKWESSYRQRTGASFSPTPENARLLIGYIESNFNGVISVENLDKAMEACRSQIKFDVPPRDPAAEEKARQDAERVAFCRKVYAQLEEKLSRSCGGQLSQDETARRANFTMLDGWLRKNTGIKHYSEITVNSLMKAVSALYKSGRLVWDTPPNLDQLAKVKNSVGQDGKENALDASGLGSTLRMVQDAAMTESKLKADQIDSKTKTEIETTWGRTHSRAKDFREQLKKLYDNLQAEPSKEAPHQKAQRIQDAVLTLQKKLQSK